MTFWRRNERWRARFLPETPPTSRRLRPLIFTANCARANACFAFKTSFPWILVNTKVVHLNESKLLVYWMSRFFNFLLALGMFGRIYMRSRPTQKACKGGLKLREQKNLANSQWNQQLKHIVVGPQTHQLATVIELQILCGEFDKTVLFESFRHLCEILLLYHHEANQS